MWYYIGISAAFLVGLAIYLICGYAEKMEDLVKAQTSVDAFRKQSKKCLWRAFWSWTIGVFTATAVNLTVVVALDRLGKTTVIACAVTGAICIIGTAIALVTRKNKNE